MASRSKRKSGFRGCRAMTLGELDELVAREKQEEREESVRRGGAAWARAAGKPKVETPVEVGECSFLLRLTTF